MVFLLAPDHKRFFAPALCCFGLCLLFGWICAQFYLPGKGFTCLIQFGGLQHERFLPALKAVNHYEVRGAPGYDAQYYAQIAMDPHFGSPDLRRAVDSLPYRGRRILLSWIAYALAGGDSLRALHIFAVENIVCWFALALLFFRWASPFTWTGAARWTALLFTFGLCCSVRGALVDGPSLLLIASAVALAEEKRLWLAAIVLGAAGLAKETNLLAGVILLPGAFRANFAGREAGERSLNEPVGRAGGPSVILDSGWRRRWVWAGRLVVAVAPLMIWLAVMQRWVGRAEDLGARNFAAPLVGYLGKWREVAAHIRAQGLDLVGRGSLVVLVALTVQWIGVVCRPNWESLWWRVGAAFAALGAVLGPAVWEGYPGAAARVLLPLTAAFVVEWPLGEKRPAASERMGALRSTFARKRRRVLWWSIFVVGSASVFVSADILAPPGRESVSVRGPRALRMVARTGQIVDAAFSPEWYEPEKSWFEYWRWCRGSGNVTFANPHPFPVTADIRFGLRANDERTVAVRTADRTLWLGRLEPAKLRDVEIKDVVLAPGRTTWRFETFTPPIRASSADARDLTFSLRNLVVLLHAR